MTTNWPDIQKLVARKMRALERHRERFAKAWMLHTGVMNPSNVEMCVRDEWKDGALTTSTWFRLREPARPERIAELESALEELIDEADSLDGMNRNERSTTLESFLEPNRVIEHAREVLARKGA